MPWMDIDTFFEGYNNQHDKKYPLPTNSTLKNGKRTDEIMKKELQEENKKYNWRK